MTEINKMRGFNICPKCGKRKRLLSYYCFDCKTKLPPKERMKIEKDLGYCQSVNCQNRGKELPSKELVRIGNYRYCKACLQSHEILPD